MEQMYQDYKDIAEFYIVYISEAHAADDRRPADYAKELNIKEHTTYGERCTVATRLQKEKKLTIPCLIDGMDNAVAKSYQGFPDRVFLVRKDGTLAIAGQRGPWGFKPGMNRAKTWLASYKETGREPDIVVEDDGPDIGELMRSFYGAMRRSDYDKAIEVGAKLHRVSPDDAGTMYNLACVHCLKGNKEKAYRWLEMAVAAGYDDADHTIADDDFKTMRSEERFENLVKRMRERGSSAAASSSIDPSSYEPILGDWDMNTTRGENSIPAIMSLSIKDGKLVGVWASHGREMPMSNITFADNTLTFTRSMRRGMKLRFKGTVDGELIKGTYKGPFGDIQTGGTLRKPS